MLPSLKIPGDEGEPAGHFVGSPGGLIGVIAAPGEG